MKSRAHWPKISVVTPSFNQAPFIEQTIGSVLEQGYPNLEYIVMDGGSTDGSVELIRKHARHLAHWQSGRDGGQGAAILEGWKRATGELITWINSDDVLLAGSLERVARAYRPDRHYYYGDLVLIDAHGLTTDYRLAPDDVELFFKNGLAYHDQAGTFYSRRHAEEVGYFRVGLDLCMEYDLMFALLNAGARMHRIDGPLAAFREYATQKSRFYARKFDLERRAVFRERIRSVFRHSYARFPAGKLLRAILKLRYLDPDTWPRLARKWRLVRKPVDIRTLVAHSSLTRSDGLSP